MSKKKKRSSAETSTYGTLVCGFVLLMALCILLLSVLAGKGKSSAAEVTVSASGMNSVRINEVMAANEIVPVGEGFPDWIELYNAGAKDVSLAGWSLMQEHNPSEIYRLPAAIIPAGGYQVIYCDEGDGEWHAPFKLASSGESLILMDASGRDADRLQTPELSRKSAYALDEAGKWQITYAPTLGIVNQIVLEKAEEVAEEAAVEATAAPVLPSVSGVIEITEVMSKSCSYGRDDSGVCQDYVELHNTSAETVDLRGWYLSDTAEIPNRWQFPDATIGPDGYLTVYCSGMEEGASSTLQANFKLGSDGCTVFLTRSDNTTETVLTVPALEADQAYQKIGDMWSKNYAPTPGMAYSLQNAATIAQQGSTGSVLINEIAAASNAAGMDWIELTNVGGEAVDLSGWGLSDNSGRPRKWQFPAGTVIQPGQFLAVACNGADTVLDGKIATSFNLSLDGGYTVTLCKPDGTIVDRVFLPQQYADMSYGRVDGQQGFFYLMTPTLMERNTGMAYPGRASKPVYSVEGGLFRTGDVLEISMSSEPGTRIYYTLDNTDPTQSSTLYTGPITVTSTTILRTRVYGDSYMESYMDTQSYLFDVNNGNGVYVVSLVSDPANLFSDEKGIMIKGPNALAEYPYGSMNRGANFWMDWEREAHVEIFGGTGETLLSQGCGIKLHGQYSRAEKQQAFKVIARAEYGGSRFEIPLFSNRDYTEYQSFLLRSSGQDTDKTRMRDSILTALAKDTSVMYQETEICVVYLDGQYWGQYNIRERINTAMICQFEGWEGDEDKIDLIKANSNVMQGSNDTFEALLQWVKKTDPTSSDFYATLDKAIDIRNYIEYMAVEIFTGNTDTLNVKRYRNANADGKWRWILFDLDWAFTTDTNSINRWVTPGGMGNGGRTDNTLFVACMKNPQFRDEFLTYFGEQLATTFSTANINRMAQERYEVLQPLLADQFAKWGASESKYNSEMRSFLQYAAERPAKLLTYFKGATKDSKMKMTDEEMVKYFTKAKEVIENGAS